MGIYPGKKAPLPFEEGPNLKTNRPEIFDLKMQRKIEFGITDKMDVRSVDKIN